MCVQAHQHMHALVGKPSKVRLQCCYACDAILLRARHGYTAAHDIRLHAHSTPSIATMCDVWQDLDLPQELRLLVNRYNAALGSEATCVNPSPKLPKSRDLQVVSLP